MADKKTNFTAATLRDLPAPAPGKRTYYYDERSPGLELMHKDSGVKTFSTRRWMKEANGPVRVLIGRFPDIDIATARKINAENVTLMARGINPNYEKQAKRSELTFGEHFEWCLEVIFKVHNKSWRKYEAIYNHHLVRWKNRPLSSIATPEIQALHARLGKENGPYAANRLLQLLHSVYTKATGRGYDKPNPVSGIRKFREKSRERFLEAHELPAFFEAVANEPNGDIRDYVLLSLLTGARRANVSGMRWKDVNLQSQIWHIPETKNGTPQRIPLIREAVEILRSRAGNGSEFVFPGPGKRGHLAEPRKGWERILKRAGIHDLRLHDLRRSLGSWQAATGANLSVIGKTLNHKNVATTAIYARLNLDPVRSAVEVATKAMFDAGKVTGGAKLLSFPEGQDLSKQKKAG